MRRLARQLGSVYARGVIGDAVLLAYCCGGGHRAVPQDLCIRRIVIDG